MWKKLQAEPPNGHTRWSLSLMAVAGRHWAIVLAC